MLLIFTLTGFSIFYFHFYNSTSYFNFYHSSSSHFFFSHNLLSSSIFYCLYSSSFRNSSSASTCAGNSKSSGKGLEETIGLLLDDFLFHFGLPLFNLELPLGLALPLRLASLSFGLEGLEDEEPFFLTGLFSPSWFSHPEAGDIAPENVEKMPLNIPNVPEDVPEAHDDALWYLFPFHSFSVVLFITYSLSLSLLVLLISHSR